MMTFRVAGFDALGGPWSTSSTFKWCLLAPVVLSRFRTSHRYYKMDLEQVYDAPKGHKIQEREDEVSGS